MATYEPVDVLLVGAGEYTTGFVHGQVTTSDKRTGVVGLVMFDLRRRGLVNRIAIADIDGTRWAGIRSHFRCQIADVYKGLDTQFDSFPDDSVALDTQAYLKAMDTLKPGSLVIIFTPDDTHFPIASAAVQRRLHVLVAKPVVKTLQHHVTLLSEARNAGVLVAVEFHKRWDPCYQDARHRIKNTLGEFGFFHSFMAQPKSQLHTFRHWAGKASDISYYLNSHHIDFHCWSLAGKARPIRVTASGATGYSCEVVNAPKCEDTISLFVEWENLPSRSRGHAVYTASWIIPKGDVHSQQHFYYMGHSGDVKIDQAHRGYYLTTDVDGLSSVNPLYMKYTPDHNGYFSGQKGYGYQSLEAFVEAVLSINQKGAKVSDFEEELGTISSTVVVTAILEAGRLSLDNQGRPFELVYCAESPFVPDSLKAF